MILYHAGEWGGKGGYLIDLAKEGHLPHVLLSFAFLQKDVAHARNVFDELRASGVRRIFLDSGAFTAWNQGTTIDLAAYEEAIDVLEPDVYVQLDVIGDPVGTRENLLQMKADGYDPLPVFTRGAQWSDLRRLVDEGYDYICLGNIAKASIGVRRDWLNGVFATIGPGIKTHGFGVTNPKILLEYPFYTVDSSAAATASAYGAVLAFRDGRFAQRHPSKDPAWAARMPHLTDHIAGGKMYTARRAENLAALNAMAIHTTKVWQERGVVWDDQPEHLA